jgi:hypothetical protein
MQRKPLNLESSSDRRIQELVEEKSSGLVRSDRRVNLHDDREVRTKALSGHAASTNLKALGLKAGLSEAFFDAEPSALLPSYFNKGVKDLRALEAAAPMVEKQRSLDDHDITEHAKSGARSFTCSNVS